MATRYTNLWDETTPGRDDIAGYLGDRMQDLKVDLRERLQFPQWPMNYKRKDLGAVSAGTVNMDYDDGQVFTLAMPSSGTVTLSISNLPSESYDEKAASVILVLVTNPGSGTPTLVHPSGTSFGDGAPYPSLTAGKKTLWQYVTFDGGATFVGAMLVTGI